MSNSQVSFFIVVLFVLFWIYMVLKITVFRIIRLRKADARAESGEQVSGNIVSSTTIGKGKFKVTKIEVEFPNFARTPITEEFKFVDSKPEEHRYDVGKRVHLLIDRNAKPGTPRVKLFGGKTMVGKGYLLFSAMLLSFTFYGAWYIYKATLVKAGGDLKNTDALFAANESMPAMGITFLVMLIFQFALFRVIGRSMGAKRHVSDDELKYHGEKTMATITRYEDTNVEINNNPMVKFYYTYQDKSGTTHQGEDKSVVGKLEIGRLPEMKEKEIFYLPQSPEKSKFTANMKPNMLGGCLNGVLVFEALVFTVILLSVYLDGIL